MTKRIFEPFGNLLQREFQSVRKSFFLWWKFVFVSENGFFKFSTVVESLQKERLSICFQKTFDGDIFQPLWAAYCISTVKGWYMLFSLLNSPFFLLFSEKKYFCAAASQLTQIFSRSFYWSLLPIGRKWWWILRDDGGKCKNMFSIAFK